VWPTFFVPGSIDLTPTASDLGGDAVGVAPQSADASLWALPVPQLLVLLGVLLVVAALFWRRRRFTAALDRAREEGRLAASDSAAASDAELSPAATQGRADPAGTAPAEERR